MAQAWPRGSPALRGRGDPQSVSALTRGGRGGGEAVSKDSWWWDGRWLQPGQLSPHSSLCPVRQPPSPPSPDELPANVKQAYRTFAAVPGLHPPLEAPAQVGGGPRSPAACSCQGARREGPALRACSPQPPTPGPTASPEQLSFRERQKYFELEVRVPQIGGPPKRVSLVGADDLRKMQEEEGKQPTGLGEGGRGGEHRLPT